MRIRNEEELENLKVGGRRLADVLDMVLSEIKAGVNIRDLDKIAEDEINRLGDKPAFKGYKPSGADRPFPSTLCVSVNDEVVHGISNERDLILKDGDIVSVDCGLIHNGFIVDAARTKHIGTISNRTKALITSTKAALLAAIENAKPGNTVGDIGHAIEEIAKENGFSIPPELGGHGVGREVHEEPFIPNIGDKGEGQVLKDGDVIAIEPIMFEGESFGIDLDEDGYTYRTQDGSLAAHFEETVVVGDTPIVLTQSRV